MRAIHFEFNFRLFSQVMIVLRMSPKRMSHSFHSAGIFFFQFLSCFPKEPRLA